MADSPVAELQQGFSDDQATATPWDEAREHLDAAEVFWLSTVRPDGRPHVTPLIAVRMDDGLYFSTGAGERKAKNLEVNKHCVLTTGCNALHEGLDVVVEGDALRVTDQATLQRAAEAFFTKYGPEWRFTASDGAFHHKGGEALVFAVTPAKAFGYGRQAGTYSATRWRF